MTGPGLDRDAIVFEDGWLIAVNKPSGLVVIETPKKEERTLTKLLNAYLDSKGVEVNAYPCHRIDRETSGLILYAKGKSIQKLMMDEFKARRVKKLYTAFVHGRLETSRATLESYLFNRNKKKKEFALTRYRVLERKAGFSVVEVEPVTGRTNQIRRQFRDIAHPLLGERLYAFARDYPVKFRRVALHAGALEFAHPVTKERVSLAAALPRDMRDFLAKAGGWDRNR